MLTKSKAKEIFFDILEHSGDFSDDRSEWCYALDLDPEDVEAFIAKVNVMIDGMGEEIVFQEVPGCDGFWKPVD